ncbi:hypothetical protein Poli38472_012156 [Pythium oligandrum]|uniref:Uncharacterized protein n=1 Tax=Pythium oligandrum TaxID=41045 RepID=A0A8K1CQU0_PYTOL|nr:hypothetical protein Poli38472_012150 [Pythium oligandrum]TMW67040.1 hypothetical protein Poli38472_012156 [Pythium oligandrum]|eukprot:TMW67034.1 hypothetical protein Poli38472_012150 [Pythium oligandrum]
MKLFASAVVAASVAQLASAQTILYNFEPELTAGVNGVALVEYQEFNSTKANIFLNFDFSGVDQGAIRKSDGNCTSDVVQYKWHIHVNWNSLNGSESFNWCSKALTGNHYDPLKACGPNSEFVDTPECAPRVKDYACNPDNYAKNPLACEKGDLSGKFGDIKLTKDKTFSAQYTDVHYPLFSENTPQWNMILHASCGKATPRIACAVGRQVFLTDDYWGSSDSSDSDDYNTPYSK